MMSYTRMKMYLMFQFKNKILGLFLRGAELMTPGFQLYALTSKLHCFISESLMSRQILLKNVFFFSLQSMPEQNKQGDSGRLTNLEEFSVTGVSLSSGPDFQNCPWILSKCLRFYQFQMYKSDLLVRFNLNVIFCFAQCSYVAFRKYAKI